MRKYLVVIEHSGRTLVKYYLRTEYLPNNEPEYIYWKNGLDEPSWRKWSFKKDTLGTSRYKYVIVVLCG